MGVDRYAMRQRAVFLDRDGVINEPHMHDGKPYPPRRPEDLTVVPGAQQALTKLKQHSFLLIVVTNQPDVARGKTKPAEVEEIHGILASQLPLDDFFTCLHDDPDACSCRKPLPGLLEQASLKYHIDLEDSYMIGDRWRDIDAGAAVRCRTILIDRGYNERGPERDPDKRAQSLQEAVDWILQEEAKSV